MRLAIFFADRAVCSAAALPREAAMFGDVVFVVLCSVGFSLPALFVILPVLFNRPNPSLSKEIKLQFGYYESFEIWIQMQRGGQSLALLIRFNYLHTKTEEVKN